ncbi:hypothetical protein KEM56_005086 [Ascosphaera pollenicola]|nr:hypothetical protein KEM56_005086 [Ascosphaera pollenicola]
MAPLCEIFNVEYPSFEPAENEKASEVVVKPSKVVGWCSLEQHTIYLKPTLLNIDFPKSWNYAQIYPTKLGGMLGQPYRGTWGYPNFRLWYLPDKPRPYLALLLISFAPHTPNYYVYKNTGFPL